MPNPEAPHVIDNLNRSSEVVTSHGLKYWIFRAFSGLFRGIGGFLDALNEPYAPGARDFADIERRIKPRD